MNKLPEELLGRSWDLVFQCCGETPEDEGLHVACEHYAEVAHEVFCPDWDEWDPDEPETNKVCLSCILREQDSF